VSGQYSFAGKNNVIVLEGVISSVKEDTETGCQLLMLSYEELDQSDKILLHAFLYEQILINMNIINDPSV
jgi:hypothetical protein